MFVLTNVLPTNRCEWFHLIPTTIGDLHNIASSAAVPEVSKVSSAAIIIGELYHQLNAYQEQEQSEPIFLKLLTTFFIHQGD